VGEGGRGLPEVERVHGAVRLVDQHEPASPDAAGGEVQHADGVEGGHGRVDGVATATHDLEADLGGSWVLGRDGAAPCFVGGLRACAGARVKPRTRVHRVRPHRHATTVSWRRMHPSYEGILPDATSSPAWLGLNVPSGRANWRYGRAAEFGDVQ